MKEKKKKTQCRNVAMVTCPTPLPAPPRVNTAWWGNRSTVPLSGVLLSNVSLQQNNEYSVYKYTCFTCACVFALVTCLRWLSFGLLGKKKTFTVLFIAYTCALLTIFSSSYSKKTSPFQNLLLITAQQGDTLVAETFRRPQWSRFIV